MALTRCQRIALEPYNRMAEIVFSEDLAATDRKELREVEEKANIRSNISSHLPTIFLETVASKPSLIVELGTWKGFSTFALSKAAMVVGAVLVGVDKRDFSKSSDWEDWLFVQMDDLDFAKQFPAWCAERKIAPSIDVLFIDTSHEYEHTKKEIAAFFPFLSANAKVLFHDTNCSGWYRGTHNTIYRGWNNKRGVIRAIEDYFGRPFDEKRRFVAFVDGWLIEHDPICNGLMTLRRILHGTSYGENVAREGKND